MRLQRLSDQGNTLVVVEHDEDTIRRADHIIDIGPSAGKRGGTLVAEGTVRNVTDARDSQTGRYLLHAMKHPLQPRRACGVGSRLPRWGSAGVAGGNRGGSASIGLRLPEGDGALQWLTVHGAACTTCRHVTAQVPLKRLVAVTGVSGSGKSTLARDVLLANVQAVVAKRATKAGAMRCAGKGLDWSGCKG